MDTAQDSHGIGRDRGGDLEHIFSAIDRGGDGGDADGIGRDLADADGKILIRDVLRHRIDEVDVVKSCLPQMAREIGDPGGRP